MANTLYLSFVADEGSLEGSGGKKQGPVRSKMLHRVEHGYSFCRTAGWAKKTGSIEGRRERSTVASLRDFCLWRVCSEMSMYRKCKALASADIKERMDEIKALVPLWCIGRVYPQPVYTPLTIPPCRKDPNATREYWERCHGQRGLPSHACGCAKECLLAVPSCARFFQRWQCNWIGEETEYNPSQPKYAYSSGARAWRETLSALRSILSACVRKRNASIYVLLT